MIRSRQRYRGSIVALSGGAPVSSAVYDFTTGTLSSDFTFTNSTASGIATYRDASGQLQTVNATNTPRFDHDISGNSLGRLVEDSITNLLNDFNANPTGTGAWTKAGDAASVFSVVADPSGYLAAQKLTNVCTGGNVYKFDNSLGTTTATITASAAFGVTTTCVFSAYIVASGTGATLTRSGGGTPETTAITTTFGRKFVMVTPNATTDKPVISVPAGVIVYFILQQSESNSGLFSASAFATSVVIVVGTTRQRSRDQCFLNPVGKTWYNASAISVLARVAYMGQTNGTTRFPFCFSDSTSSNLIGTSLASGTGSFIAAQLTSSGSALATANTQERPQYGQGKYYPHGIISNNTIDFTVFGGGGTLNSSSANSNTISSYPTGINRLDVGSRNGGSGTIFGWIKDITIWNAAVPHSTITASMFNSGDRAFITGGQSNMKNYLYSVQSSNDLGRLAMISTADGIWNDGNMNLFGWGGTPTTCLVKDSDSNPTDGLWWYDDNTNTYGPAYETWLAVAQFMTSRATAIIWDQGEQDSTAIHNGTMTKARYKAALITMIAKQRSVVGNVPFIIIPLGRREKANNEYQSVREAQQEIAADNTMNTWLAPEKADLDLYQGDTTPIHLTDAATQIQGPRVVRKMASVLGKTVTGEVDGPTVTAASFVSSTVTITLTSGTEGTDFTPTTGLTGWHVFDSTNRTSEIAVTAAVRTNATTITLTLASAPLTTTPELVYIYSNEATTLVTTDYTKFVIDNAAAPLPLRSMHALLPFSPPAKTQVTWGNGTILTWGNGTQTTWSA